MKKIEINTLAFIRMVKLLKKNNHLQSSGYDIEHCNIYLDGLKFGEIYGDIINKRVDTTLKRYHFEMCDVIHFRKVNTCENYIKTMIKRYLRNIKE